MRAGSGLVEALRSAIARRPHAFVVGLIVLASLAERLHVSHECSLWLDEVTTLRDSWSSRRSLLLGASPEHPPLMFWLTRGAMELFGRGETAMRLPSLLFGCGLLVAVYGLCRELLLSPTRSVIVMGSMALTPFYIRHATEARQYAIVMTFMTLAATFAFRLARGESRRRDLVGFLLSVTGGAATHYFAMAYGFALLAFVVVSRRASRQTTVSAHERRVFMGFVLATLAPLVVIAFGAARLGRHYGLEHATQATFNWHFFGHFLDEFAFGASSAWTWSELLAAAAGLVLLGRTLRGFSRLVPFALTFAPVACAPFISAQHFVAVRYLAPSFVFYHLGACVAWFALFDQVVRGIRNVGVLERLGPKLAQAVFAVPILLRLAEFPNGYGAGEDYYAGAQRYYGDQLERDTGFVAFRGHFGHMIFDLDYRLPKHEVIPLETFRPLRGVKRYLVVEIHANPRQDELEALVLRHFGLSAERWRALPRVDLPHTLYQPAVPARLVELDDHGPAKPSGRHRAARH